MRLVRLQIVDRPDDAHATQSKEHQERGQTQLLGERSRGGTRVQMQIRPMNVQYVEAGAEGSREREVLDANTTALESLRQRAQVWVIAVLRKHQDVWQVRAARASSVLATPLARQNAGKRFQRARMPSHADEFAPVAAREIKPVQAP